MLQQGFCQDQVADDFPRTGQQANQIATFVDPDMEEIEFEDLDEEDFAPPSATNSHRETSQVQLSYRVFFFTGPPLKITSFSR